MAAVEKILLQFEADIKDLKSELSSVKSQLGNVDKQVETTGSKMTNTFKNIGKAIAGAFAIREVVRFGQEAIRLAATLEGVERAFNRISKPGLLDELRKQTKGTVSDLELMQNAVKASNFQIPLEQLGRLFAFAQQRARETGESVDYLVDSIVLGIGRKSPLILDNLGISAVRLRSEFKGLGVETAEVGDVAAAVGRIIDEEMTKAGDTTTDAADASDQLIASIANLKVELGKELSPALTEARKALSWFLEVAVEGTKYITAAVMGAENYSVMIGERLSSDAERGARAMENFNKFFTENKRQFSSSKEAAEAYVEVLAKQIRVYNKRMATEEAGQDLMKIERDLLAQNINTIEDYIKTLDGEGGLNEALDEVNKKVLDLSESLDVLPKILSDTYDPLSKLPDSFDRLAQAMIRLYGENSEPNKAVTDFYANLEASMESADDANIEFFENLEQKRRDDIQGQNDWFDNLENGLRASQTLFGSYGQLLIEIGGKQSALADFGRQLAFFEIASAQAVAVANAVKLVSTSAKTPIDYFVFLASILSSIAGTISKSRSLIEGQSAPLPAFAEGVVDLQGKGTETSDSIMARLSKGESVITAKGTRQDKGLFEAANKLELESYIKDNYILPALKEKKQRDDVVYDDYRIYLAMMNNQRAVKDGSRDIVKAIARKQKRYDWT